MNISLAAVAGATSSNTPRKTDGFPPMRSARSPLMGRFCSAAEFLCRECWPKHKLFEGALPKFGLSFVARWGIRAGQRARRGEGDRYSVARALFVFRLS